MLKNVYIRIPYPYHGIHIWTKPWCMIISYPVYEGLACEIRTFYPKRVKHGDEKQKIISKV